jgi:hypothetical protein
MSNTYEPHEVAPADIHRVETPNLQRYAGSSVQGVSANSIFRVSKKDLALLFSKKNLKLPDNAGEKRTALNVLKDMGYSYGLC